MKSEKIKQKHVFFVFLLLIVNIAGAQDLVILHTNDIHSHLNGFAPETEYTPLTNDNDATLGGMARIAGFIKEKKTDYGADKTLVVDAGDFLMGTLFQTIEPTAGFQLNLMKTMGYDFVALGNHEFDYGPNVLAEIIRNNKSQGDIPQLICSNYLDATTDDKDLQQFFNDGTIAKYKVIEKNGLKIGVFGLVGIDAEESIASYFGLQWKKPKKVAKATSKYLKEVEHADLVVALSHSGVWKDKKGEWGGEDIKYAKAALDIDIIISAHTHTCLNEIIHSGNAAIVQTGSYGTKVGQLTVNMKNGTPEVTYQLVEMNDDIKADAAIQEQIDSRIAPIEKNTLSVIDESFSAKIAKTSFELTINEEKPMQSNLGSFVADANYYFLNSVCKSPVDVTLVAAGVIRNNIEKGQNGYQNINDIFNVMPLGSGDDNIPGSPLGKIYVNGRELKKVLELILAVSPKHTSYYLYYSGIQIDYNPEKGLFRKISAIRIGNDEKGYKLVDTSKKNNQLYSIAANKYMISFMGKIKKMSHGLVKVVPKNSKGEPIVDDNFLVDVNPDKDGLQEAKEWLSMYYFIKSFKDNDNDGIPEIPEVYKEKRNPLIVVK